MSFIFWMACWISSVFAQNIFTRCSWHNFIKLIFKSFNQRRWKSNLRDFPLSPTIEFRLYSDSIRSQLQRLFTCLLNALLILEFSIEFLASDCSMSFQIIIISVSSNLPQTCLFHSSHYRNVATLKVLLNLQFSYYTPRIMEIFAPIQK